jgi:hypothetical protein
MFNDFEDYFKMIFADDFCLKLRKLSKNMNSILVEVFTHIYKI